MTDKYILPPETEARKAKRIARVEHAKSQEVLNTRELLALVVKALEHNINLLNEAIESAHHVKEGHGFYGGLVWLADLPVPTAESIVFDLEESDRLLRQLYKNVIAEGDA
jgi:hypothetical protein